MAHDDFEVVVYKVLSYLDKCLKSDIEPSIEQMQRVAGVNDTYFKAVINSLINDGYIVANVYPTWHGAIYRDISLTMQGAIFLKDNSKMNECRQFLGKAFTKTLTRIIEATIATNLQ